MDAHRKTGIVYGCNIDFILPLGKGNYVLNYKDVLVSCQRWELYWPCGWCGCFAAGDMRKLRAPKCSSAETADLEFAESAPNNKVTQTPLMKEGLCEGERAEVEGRKTRL